MILRKSQEVLAQEILKTGKPVIAFLNHSKPIALGSGVVQQLWRRHYAGAETGTAAAEILFGSTNPSGKLSLSWPNSISQIPVHYSQHNSALIFDYLDAPKGAEYPFRVWS